MSTFWGEFEAISGDLDVIFDSISEYFAPEGHEERE